MLILLKCPKCQGQLQGENNSKIFFCGVCDLGYDVDDHVPRNYQLFYIEPKIKRDSPQVYFPFWRICSEYRIIEAGGISITSQKKYFYIPAFFIKNVNYFGDLGYYFTFKNVRMDRVEKKDLPIFPADRSLKDCIAYPLIYLFQDETKKKKRKESFEIQIDHKEISIVLVSFYKTNGDYQDSIIFWKYPSGALI